MRHLAAFCRGDDRTAAVPAPLPSDPDPQLDDELCTAELAQVLDGLPEGVVAVGVGPDLGGGEIGDGEPVGGSTPAAAEDPAPMSHLKCPPRRTCRRASSSSVSSGTGGDGTRIRCSQAPTVKSYACN